MPDFDYGLIEGIGNALNQGFDSYIKERDRQAKIKDNKRAEILKARISGFIPKLDDSGEVVGYDRDPNDPKRPLTFEQRLELASARHPGTNAASGRLSFDQQKEMQELKNQGLMRGLTPEQQFELQKMRATRGAGAGGGRLNFDEQYKLQELKNRGLIDRAKVSQPYGGEDARLKVQELKNQGALTLEEMRQQRPPHGQKTPLSFDEQFKLQELKNRGLVEREGAKPVRPGSQEKIPLSFEQQKELQELKNRGLIEREGAKPVRPDRPYFDPADTQEKRNQGLIELEKLKQQGKQVKTPEDKATLQELKNQGLIDVQKLRNEGALGVAKLRPAPKAAAGKSIKAGKPPPPSEYEKKKGRDFGSQVAEWRTKDRAQLADNLSKLEDAINILANEEGVTGGMKGYLPSFADPILNPNARMAKDAIDSATVETLRPTLGAQFTAAEGSSIKALNFDKRLPQKENLKRAQRLAEKMRMKLQLADSLADYLDQHQGSDLGFPYQNYGHKVSAPGTPPPSKKGAAPAAKPTVQINRKLNKTRFVYPDGHVEEVDGIQTQPR